MPIEVSGKNVRARIHLPNEFEEGSFRTIIISEEKGIKAVVGKLIGETTMTIQTYLFDIETHKWAIKKVKAWLKEHNLIVKSVLKSIDFDKLVDNYDISELLEPYLVELENEMKRKKYIMTEQAIAKSFDVSIEDEKDDLYEMTNLKIVKIATTKSPAVPGANTIVMKSENSDSNTIQKSIEIVHKNIKGEIFQYGLVPNHIDYQGEMITEEEIEKTTNRLQKTIADGGLGFNKEHKGTGNEYIDYIKYAIYDITGNHSKAEGIPQKKIVKGGMLVAIQLTPTGIEAYNEKKFTGISIEGDADTTSIQKNDTALVTWLGKLVSKLYNLISKEGSNMSDYDKKWITEDTARQMMHAEIDVAMDKLETNIINGVIAKMNKEEKKDVEDKTTETAKSEPNESKVEAQNKDSNVEDIEKKMTVVGESLKEMSEKINANQIQITKSMTDLTTQMTAVATKFEEKIGLIDKMAQLKGVAKSTEAESSKKSNINQFSGGLYSDEPEQKAS